MAKLNEIIVSTQQFQVGQATLTTRVDDLELWVNGQKPNGNNRRYEVDMVDIIILKEVIMNIFNTNDEHHHDAIMRKI